MTKRVIVGHQSASSAVKRMWLFGALTAGLLYFIQVSFYLGDMSIYTQNRFAMAYLPYMVYPAIFFMFEILNDVKFSKKIFVFTFFVFHLIFFWSYGAQQLLVNAGSLPYEYNKTLSYLKDKLKNNSNILVVSEHPNLYIVQYPGAVDFTYANQNVDKILIQYQREFDHIVVLQKCRYETRTPLRSNRLTNSYRLVWLGDIKLTRSEYLRVSEVSEDG